jgi:hypothetical protein
MERTSLKYFATLILAMTLVACNSEPAPTEQEIHDANLRKYSAGTLQTELRSHYFPVVQHGLESGLSLLMARFSKLGSHIHA